MTKTLTEKWREGTLPEGWYYMQDYTGRHCYRYLLGVKPDSDFVKCFKKVLAPVPSYDEYKELVSKTDKLEKMAFHYTPEEWNTMLRTIERLQEQLDDANKALKQLVCFGVVTEETKAEYEDPDDWECTDVAQEYLDKWGVK